MAQNRQNIERYLHKTLGIRAELEAWSGRKRLPLFLREGYHFFETKLLGTSCLLMLDRSPELPSPGAIRKQMVALDSKWDGELIYVGEQMDASQRRRLIEHKVPFLVPDKQLYLPMLGVDLREHFRKQRTKSVTFKPATQVLILQLLLRPHEKLGTVGDYAERLHYTNMTMTRAFNAIADEELCEVFKEGRERRLRLIGTRNELWKAALPKLKSPVKSTRKGDWNIVPKLPCAGLTALGRMSMLDGPNRKVVAVWSKKWKSIRENFDHSDSWFQQHEDATEVQLWNYDPMLFATGKRVDPLSLYLSLRDTQDERVEAALDEMMEQMTW